ncbi:MAG: gluconate 2-dehydrogenase subunit 3 family protein [Myxococcales bacterium]|nr:gluconate 2-dehydrogenase subunit 3 family protein [Myxococcales bacterium]
MGITRRHVLAGCVGVCGLAIVGGGAVAVVTAPAPGAALLSTRELLIVRALAEVMFPADPFPIDGVEAGVPEEVDRILSDMLAPLHANGFRAILHLLEWGTAASRGTPFSQLSVDLRREVLATWADPEVFTRRVADDAFRLVLGMAYFQHPRVLEHMGWSLGCVGRGEG